MSIENPIAITQLNDFVFCPASIYFHMLDFDTDKMAYQDECQINGTAAHAGSDSRKYSTKKSVMQNTTVFCERYGLIGKIDVFDADTGMLTERKRTIKNIFDGYVFQLYAQYYSLVEMGFYVKTLRLYSITDNKSYYVPLPGDDKEMSAKFEKTIFDLRNFSFDDFQQKNSLKCLNCIYEPLCSFSNCHTENNDYFT